MTTITDVEKQLNSLLDNLVNKMGSDIDPNLLEELDLMRATDIIKTHLRVITKDRSIKLSGDVGHLSIDYIINKLFNKIDEPKQYDFQKDNVNEEDFLHYILRCIPYYIMRGDFKKEQLVDALEGKGWFKVPSSYDCKCYDCMQQLALEFNGNEVRLSAENPCSNNREFTIEVDFPTGEVVFDDWPARFSEAKDAGFLFETNDLDINYLKGQRMRTDEFASQQIVHHSVGNTCPNFYVNKNTSTIQIGGGKYNEETDEYEVAEGLEDVGYFCTDLWWVTMLDRKFYDAIVNKLPDQRDIQYYEKELNIAHIQPGRYRFTCYGRSNADMEVFMIGERIGDCSDFMPTFDIMDSKRLMTLDEAIVDRMQKYPTQYNNSKSAKFAVLDHVFNVIGNGLNSKGDFFSAFSVDTNAVFEPLVSTNEPVEIKTPYPNFQKQYSLIWEMPVKELPTDWLQGVLWYYEQCQIYFNNGAEDYNGAYPSKQNRDDEFAKYIERYRKDGQTEEEFNAVVSKAYETEFRGDITDFQQRRWNKEKTRILDFIKETLTHINEELSTR